MSSLWRDINSYTQGQKRALIFIWVLIIAVATFSMIQERYFQDDSSYLMIDSILTKMANEKYVIKEETKTIEIKNLFNPNESTKEQMVENGLPENIANNIYKLRKAGKKYKKPEDLKVIYGMSDSIYRIILPYINIPTEEIEKKEQEKTIAFKKFNPNTVNYDELIDMGMPSNIAKNIINYRNSGAVFRSPADLLKLYSIDSILYNEILQFIDIPEKTVKIEIKIVELNTSTPKEISISTDIDTYQAYKIVNYRERLGGFINYNQLETIEGVEIETINKIKQYTWIDTLQIKKINLNTVDYKTLIKHPLSNKEITEKIIRYRKFTKKINTIEELIKNRVVNKQDITKLKPYLSFE